MILTCPACSTRYTVADTSLGDAGRTVRCASCGHSWFQARPEAVEAEAMVSRVAKAAPKVFAAKPPPPQPHAQARAKSHARIKAKHFAYAASPWAIAILIMLGLTGAALVNRVAVVKLWPKSASAFAAIGLPANPFGLVIENQTVRNGADARGARMLVAGILRNETTTVRDVPYLRVTLIDDHGKDVANWLVDAGKPKLAPGEKHPFVTDYPKPPPTARKVVISFADEPGMMIDPSGKSAEEPHAHEGQVVPASPPPISPDAPIAPSGAGHNAPHTPGALPSTQSELGAPIKEDPRPVRQAVIAAKPKPKPIPKPTPPPTPEVLPKSFIKGEPAAAPPVQPSEVTPRG